MKDIDLRSSEPLSLENHLAIIAAEMIISDEVQLFDAQNRFEQRVTLEPTDTSYAKSLIELVIAPPLF